MMRFEKNKLFLGCVDLRSGIGWDYEYEKACKDPEGCTITVGSEYIRLTARDLKQGKLITKKIFPSEHGTPPYMLMSFKWDRKKVHAIPPQMELI